MNRHHAFTSEWIPRFGLFVFNLGVWTPIIKRALGWSELNCGSALTALAIALWLFCGLLAERNPQKAWILSNVFLLVPTATSVLLLVWLMGLVLWRHWT